MKKKIQFIKLFLFTICILAGCDKNDALQDKPKDDKEKKDPPVTITTVSGPVTATSSCGGFDWKVTYTLKNVSAKGGWIVQKITDEPDIKNCDNSVNDNTKKVYWEAWEVEANKDIWKIRDNSKGKIKVDDNFTEPNHPKTKGKYDITGELKFFEALALPATFKKNNPDTYAGTLHSTTEKPDFWDNKDAVAHNLNAVWNCCDDPTSGTVTTDPKTRGTILQLETPDTGKLDNLGKLIHQIPAWTMGYDSSKERQLANIARQIYYTPVSGLRTALQNYSDVFSNTAGSTDELSKPYLLLRVLYILPTAADRNSVQVFGGWKHPNIASTNTPFNLSWPLTVAGYGYYTQVHVTGKYSGYFGVPYDAVGELDYFNSNFERRN
jgi:hypothetical protein